MVKSFSTNQLIGLLIIIALILPYLPFVNSLAPLAQILMFIAALWLIFK